MSSIRTATEIINELHAEKHTLLARVRSLEAGLRAIVDGSSEHSEAAWLAAVDTELINDARRLLE